MQQNLDKFEAAGAQLMAISVDGAEDAQKTANKNGVTFTVLSDPGAATITAYDVLNSNAGIAKPATFLIDPSGVIAWKYIGSNKSDRPAVEAILAEIEALKG